MRYWVDKDNGVVVCKMAEQWDVPPKDQDVPQKSNIDHAIDYVSGQVKHMLMNVFQFSEWQAGYAANSIVAPIAIKHIQPVYTGKARCGGSDVFDEEAGKTLARARCLEKFYADIQMVCQDVEDACELMKYAVANRENSAEESQQYWEEAEYRMQSEE